ncbi:NAD(P)-dependent oxidoreductase [Arthrobacter sp. MA-N2]|uniref:NAD(P)-dependent oxidoreductase n=1 Tax=Arthrobacter sp. MA-N2 TaxID=1101188 RepID=UPI0004B441B1|nr:NAD(P)-dependent oxidoreductase [Arthrobacter sp. MA-N2]
MTDNATTVALVGLGNMGAAVASRLVRVGPLKGFDLSASRRDAASAMGVTAVDDLAELADADVVLLSLPTPEISLTVGRTLAEYLRPGSIIVETSTVNPADMGRLADAVSSSGIRVVDAAILSGVGGMAAGTSVLLTGGRSEDLDAVAPVLEAMSGRTIRYSELGTGMAAKVINNAVAHAVMVVLSEAASLAVATGITVEQIADLLRDPDAGLLRPLTHRIDERVRQGNYEGGMPTEAARKDSVLALQLAQAHDVPLFAIQGAHSVYELALAAGLARHDYASIATLWEGWTHSPLSDSARTPTTAV